MIRRILSRRSRSRRYDFLDDLSSYYLGFRYVFWPPSSSAWGSRICGLFVSHLLRNIHVSKHPVRDVSQFCTSWWWPVSSPCSPLLVVSYRSVRRMLALSRNHYCQFFSAQTNYLLENLAFPDDVSSVFLIFIIVSDFFYLEMILPSVASCDFACTHPPFLTSFRSLKNLKKTDPSKSNIFYV